MFESIFIWISSNVFNNKTDEPFSSSIPYKILTIDHRILIIGLIIDVKKDFVRIINQTELVPFVQQFLKSISDVKYDVLIALTHLDMVTDIQLPENILGIDLLLGGHEDEDDYLLRGSKYTSIYKADGNAYTLYSVLTKITPEICDELKTNGVVNYWCDLVSCLPAGVGLDGRSASVRNFATSLSTYCCECMADATALSKTAVRQWIDVILREQ